VAPISFHWSAAKCSKNVRVELFDRVGIFLATMSSDRSERETAQELIDEHGDDAPYIAARRAEELRSAGGEEFARWKRIVMGILDMRGAQMRRADRD
jgi:hypothetical protein